jgi:hypothetical protein
MALTAGSRLGPYEIVAPIGAGGMGEIYKARDTRLERTVAIKVLAPNLAADPEFKARFEREARSISALNHPHICTLFDVGETDSAAYLVLELLDGETLADRLKTGPLPVDQALELASQIADALDKAHRQGIVHRDLKPANVFLLKSAGAAGAPHCKLLDFGLAKIGAAAPPGSVETRLLTSPPPAQTAPLTSQGSILGTFQYMAPEQIEGQDSDARTDIWAFGCVLYEMLTGRRAFEGKSQASLIASILERQPPAITELQPLAPPALSRIVRTCLEKNPDNRFHTAHDLWLHLEWIEEGGSAAGLPAPIVAGRKRRSAFAFGAGALVLAALAAAGAWALKPAPEVTSVVGRFLYRLPEGVSFTRGGRQNVAISPDGTKIAFIAQNQIYLRRFGELDAQPIRGTNVDPVGLAFSPDGESLVFFSPTTPFGSLSSGNLKRVAVTGGALSQISPAGDPSGIVWQGNRIVFADLKSIQTVPDTGGTPETLLTLDPAAGEEVSQPQLVNDGRDLIYTVRRRELTWDAAQVVTQPAGGGPRRVLVQTGSDGRLLPTGHLVYVSNNTLFAQAMGPSLEPIGGAVPVVEGVQFSLNTTGVGRYAISDTGALVFVPGSGEITNELAWVDRKGVVEKVGAPVRAYEYARLSPDGTRIVASENTGDNDLLVWDIGHRILGNLTQGPDDDDYPVWTRDSRYVVFSSSQRGGKPDLFRRAVDGTGSLEQLTKTPAGEAPYAFLSEGRLLILHHPAESRDVVDVRLHALTLGTEQNSVPLIPESSGVQWNAEISPDGRWIAYVSMEGGAQEVHVRPYPKTDAGHWQITSGGGNKPGWSRSGKELFYTNAGRLHAVPNLTRPGSATFEYGPSAPLLDVNPYRFNVTGRPYDLSLDDQRFLVVTRAVQANEDRTIVIVTNWFDELKAKTR